jgi:hypothetical protein
VSILPEPTRRGDVTARINENVRISVYKLPLVLLGTHREPRPSDKVRCQDVENISNTVNIWHFLNIHMYQFHRLFAFFCKIDALKKLGWRYQNPIDRNFYTL